MRTERITVKTKAGDRKEDYSYPSTLAEAIEVDGEDKVLSVYLVKRKTNFMDSVRLKAERVLSKALTQNPEIQEMLLAALREKGLIE